MGLGSKQLVFPLPAASPGPALGSVSGLEPAQLSLLAAASAMVA